MKATDDGIDACCMCCNKDYINGGSDVLCLGIKAIPGGTEAV